MAITKGIENIYGVSFDYHKLVDVRIKVKDGDTTLYMTVESYRDKDARKEGKQPVRTENIILHADFALAPFYALLKAKFKDFSGASDDFEQVEKSTVSEAVYLQQTPQCKPISRFTESELKTE